MQGEGIKFKSMYSQEQVLTPFKCLWLAPFHFVSLIYVPESHLLSNGCDDFIEMFELQMSLKKTIYV